VHIPGGTHLELGALAAHADQVPAGAVVACGHGERAMTGASLLRHAGRQDVAVLDGGPAVWAAATGRPLKEGR
jgi:hydroxyacylglutathione hydrolase